ncbi:hypothetical protein GCM10011385_28520 [Nitratireductor aestuarii]|uniref:Uncharacterized protein n=2 Tax=Nitratireductor aestuarii TaxID=1735103 RepID=A0A916RW15_9HYPH|nr:hypothetical protein GCM10011385_28520 [Nitratireductor aestuarii]
MKGSKSVFDIAPRTGYWEDGSRWIPQPGRNADIYVLAYHPVDDERADHRDPAQWLFYVIATTALPDQKTVSLGRVVSLAEPRRFDGLAQSVEALRENFRSDAGDNGFAQFSIY